MKRKLFSLLVLLLTAVTGAWATDDTTVFELNGSTATTGTLTFGTSSVEATNVKIHKNTDEIAGIKFSSSYSYADGKYFTIKPATGSFKAGDKISIAVCFSNDDDTKNAKAAIYAANGTTLLYTTANGINGRKSTDDPAVEEYVLTQDADLLYIGRNGNTATYVTTLKVVRPASSGVTGEEVYYTLDTSGSVQTNNNGYSNSGSVEVDGIMWTLEGNGKINPWRIGGKSIEEVNRAVYTTTAMDEAITSVDLTIGAAPSGITVNSLKLIVASDAAFSSVLDEVTATFEASSTIKFKPTSGDSWAKDAYYKFVFNVTVSSTSNKAVEFSKVVFYKAATSSGGSDEGFTGDDNLRVASSEHSTMKFYVGQDEVTKAKEGETVTIVVTPDDGWSIGNVTGQWIAAMAKAPRRTAGIGLLQDVDVTFVSEDAQTGAHTYTFVMQRAKAEFNVVYKKHLDHPDITISNILPVIYNAQAHTPSFTVKDGSKVLVLGTDYTVTYSDNVKACDKDAAENAPTVTIKAVEGHKFYVGENSKTFTIRKKTLEDGFMSKVADLTYNGKAQEPAPTLTYDGITLVEGKDYVFSYINNKDVACTTDAKAPVVTASAVKNSNFTGAATQKFNIKKAPLTIKAADVNIIHGSEVPQYEVSYEGFVADETVAVLEGTLAVACGYTKESAVGSTYDITPSGLTAKNYDITFVPGKLTVLVNQAAVDKAAADDVMGKITAIGEVAYNETSKGLIDAAREAYNALTDAQKALVTNLETLTNAETAYANLKAAAEKAAADQLAADDVIAKITAIGEVAYNETSKGLIDAARNAYTALTEDQKALVNNYEVLTTAETTYANLKAAAEKAAADQLAAGEVIDKIIAIGEVAYTAESKALIDAARNAYSELTEDQKALVTNYEVLTVAETTYANLKAAAQQAADDQEAANEVIGKINAIGEVAYTTDCKALIDAARNAYSELTADQKALVTNYEVLTTAETTYANLKAAAEKAAADKAAADDVIAKINAIGEVAYTEACKNLIDAARNAYTALTEDQKALVTNLSVLTDAETAYAELAQIATGISTIKAIAGKTIYDMNGRKVTVPSKKGMYIINGRKVVIK